MKKPKIDITRNESGQHALNRVICYVAAVTMSLAFWKQAILGALTWLHYVGYAIGMAIAYSPVLAVKIWGKRCNGSGAPAAPAPGTDIGGMD